MTTSTECAPFTLITNYSGQAIPTAAGFIGGGSVSGEWLNYEVAITPFDYFSLSGTGLVISPLQAGQVIGIDVVAAAHDGSAFTGMKSENLMDFKYENYAHLGLHELTVATAEVVNIAQAKARDNGTLVETTGIVSAVFTDYFYIESSDRTFGIRVNKVGHGRSVDQEVTVTGPVQTLATGDRCIEDPDVTPTGGSGNITPLGLTNKALGGSSFGLQQGVAGGAGLNNIGLLIKTTGKVGAKGTDWFMIDDGSGVSVKVYGAVPSGTPYVTITGASSCEKDGSNDIQRVILATSVQTL